MAHHSPQVSFSQVSGWRARAKPGVQSRGHFLLCCSGHNWCPPSGVLLSRGRGYSAVRRASGLVCWRGHSPPHKLFGQWWRNPAVASFAFLSLRAAVVTSTRGLEVRRAPLGRDRLEGLRHCGGGEKLAAGRVEPSIPRSRASIQEGCVI